jgi:hypothetical protein
VDEGSAWAVLVAKEAAKSSCAIKSWSGRRRFTSGSPNKVRAVRTTFRRFEAGAVVHLECVCRGKYAVPSTLDTRAPHQFQGEEVVALHNHPESRNDSEILVHETAIVVPKWESTRGDYKQ